MTPFQGNKLDLHTHVMLVIGATKSANLCQTVIDGIRRVAEAPDKVSLRQLAVVEEE